MERKVDVAILGGGLSGNLLARQIRMSLPELSVALFERETERSYKVGESTVEIGSHYLVHRLGLARYIYEEHLPKNGLRFFFDTEKRDAPLPEMSELGLAHLPPYPSFQLDRLRLEEDLLRMNAADGVDVHLGARVSHLQLSKTGTPHTFDVEEDSGIERWQARWVVDSTGRGGMIARLEGLKVAEEQHRVGASWARYRGVANIDGVEHPEFRARAEDTARFLSTNHFCYRGHWIWFIPLSHGVTSVGFVTERSGWDRALTTAQGLRTRLDGYRAPRELLAGADLLDHGFLTQLSFGAKRVFSAERWAVVGDAAAFIDPFYSQGTDFIGIECDLVTDLIRRDVAGEELSRSVDLYEEFLQFRIDVTRLLYIDLYPTLGSYELFKAKVFFDTALYYNLWFDSYARDEHLNRRDLKALLRRREPIRAVMENFRRLFAAAGEVLHERGDYYRGNTGRSLLGREVFGPLVKVGGPRSRQDVDLRTEEIFNQTRAMVLTLLRGEETVVEGWALPRYAEETDLLSPSGVMP